MIALPWCEGQLADGNDIGFESRRRNRHYCNFAGGAAQVDVRRWRFEPARTEALCGAQVRAIMC